MIDGIVKELGRFTLHDGSDDKKTVELHQFLGDEEWEGDDSGVQIYPKVSVRAQEGDVIVKGENALGETTFAVVRRGGHPDKRVKVENLTVAELMVITGAIFEWSKRDPDGRFVNILEKLRAAGLAQIFPEDVAAADREVA